MVALQVTVLSLVLQRSAQSACNLVKVQAEQQSHTARIVSQHCRALSMGLYCRQYDVTQYT